MSQEAHHVASPWAPRPTTTLIIALNITIFMLQVILQTDWTYQMANRVYLTAYGHELYRYITHGFQHLSFLHLLFNMLFYYFIGNPLEASLGTLPMLGLSILFTIVEGVIYTYTYFALYVVTNFDPTKLETAVAGYSDSIFCCLWIYLVAFGIRELHFCGVLAIPARIYPFLLLLISSLNSGVSFVAHASGIACGLLYHFGFFNYITIPRPFINVFEESTALGRFLAKIPMYEKTPSQMNPNIEVEQFSWATKRYNSRQSWQQNIASVCICCPRSFSAEERPIDVRALGGPATQRSRQAVDDARARAGQQFSRVTSTLQPPSSSTQVVGSSLSPTALSTRKQHPDYELFEDDDEYQHDIELGLLSEHQQTSSSANIALEYVISDPSPPFEADKDSQLSHDTHSPPSIPINSTLSTSSQSPPSGPAPFDFNQQQHY
jgi:membrane associated rhomboid family serine protease